MINKYQLCIFIVLVNTVFSITLAPKNTLISNNPPIANLPNANTSPSITTVAGKNGANNQKGKSTEGETSKDGQVSLTPSDSGQIGSITPSTKVVSEITNAQNKETSSKSAKVVTTTSSKLNAKGKKQDLTQKQSDKQTSNNDANQQNEANTGDQQQQSSQKSKQKSPKKRSKWSFKSSSKKDTVNSSTNSQSQNQQSGISWKLFLFIFVILFAGVLYASKKMYFPNESLPEMIIDIMILFQTFLKPRSGYKAPQFKQEIDDENSITVGYDQEYGKQLFWQKNSVEGI